MNRTSSGGFEVSGEKKKTSEEEVDSLTTKMVEALETNETVNWSADVKMPSALGMNNLPSIHT